MKNILKFKIVILLLLLHNVLILNAQSQQIDNPVEHGSDCKNDPVAPDFEYTYIPDTIIGDPDQDDDGDPDPDGDNDGDGDQDTGNGGGKDPDQRDEESRFKRKVMFVHGYKGGVSSWMNAQTFLENQPDKNYETKNLKYETGDHTNLDQVATTIKSTNLTGLDNWTKEEKLKNFFIAHSMGGMALRFMQNKYNGSDKDYGGIITVGSGHKGIYAAETKVYKKPKFDAFFNQTCVALLHPEIIKLFPSVIYSIASIGGLLSNEFVEKKICNDVALPITDLLLSEKIDENLSITGNDMPEELDVKHRLALYGIEEADGTFTVTHRINRPFGQPLVVTATVDGILLPKFIGSVVAPPNDFPIWGADLSDAEGISTWSELLVNFELERNKAKHIFENPGIDLLGTKKHKNLHLMLAYENTIRYMRDASFQYEELIGGIQKVEVATYENCSCQVDYPWEGLIEEIIEYSGDCADLIGQPYGDGTIFSSVRHTTITIHSEKHLTDGFVMANSAKAMPGVDEPIKMQGSGHFQMRNDSEMGKAFDNIFKDNSYGTFWNLFK
ncbi:MAG: hypothetical protein KA161_06925 [Saprospiraceae bacterium]|nr:hypothetical protein [Saprospiraceae bacterium]